METIKANKYAPNVHIGSIKLDIDDALADILMRNVSREIIKANKYAPNVHIGSIRSDIDDVFNDIFKL